MRGHYACNMRFPNKKAELTGWWARQCSCWASMDVEADEVARQHAVSFENSSDEGANMQWLSVVS